MVELILAKVQVLELLRQLERMQQLSDGDRGFELAQYELMKAIWILSQLELEPTYESLAHLNAR